MHHYTAFLSLLYHIFGVCQGTRGKEVKYSADAECEIIFLRKLWNISLRSMWNEIRPSHLRSKYFTAKLFHLAKPNFTRRRRISLKKAHLRCRCAFFWRHHPESNWGIKVLQTSALPLGYGAGIWLLRHIDMKKKKWKASTLSGGALLFTVSMFTCSKNDNGADYGARTRHLDLGKVALYQMS